MEHSNEDCVQCSAYETKSAIRHYGYLSHDVETSCLHPVPKEEVRLLLLTPPVSAAVALSPSCCSLMAPMALALILGE